MLCYKQLQGFLVFLQKFIQELLMCWATQCFWALV